MYTLGSASKYPELHMYYPFHNQPYTSIFLHLYKILLHISTAKFCIKCRFRKPLFPSSNFAQIESYKSQIMHQSCLNQGQASDPSNTKSRYPKPLLFPQTSETLSHTVAEEETLRLPMHHGGPDLIVDDGGDTTRSRGVPRSSSLRQCEEQTRRGRQCLS